MNLERSTVSGSNTTAVLKIQLLMNLIVYQVVYTTTSRPSTNTSLIICHSV